MSNEEDKNPLHQDSRDGNNSPDEPIVEKPKPLLTESEKQAFLNNPFVQASRKYREGLKVLLDFDSQRILSFSDATLDIKRGGKILAVVQLKQQAIFEAFFTALLGSLAKASGVEEQHVAEWCGYWMEKGDPTMRQQLLDATSASTFILRYLPTIQEKVLDILVLAAAEYMFNERGKKVTGRNLIFDDSLHQKILEIEKEIRRATKTSKPGPEQSWARDELERASRKVIADLLSNGEQPSHLTVARRINKEFPDKRPFTAKERNGVGKAYGKRLRDLKLSWKDIVKEEKRRIAKK